VRYLLLREIAFDRDGDFTIEKAVGRYNAELANELGNLFSRTLSMVQRYRKGTVPAWTPESEADFERLTKDVFGDYCAHMDRLAFDEGLDALWRTVQAANRYVEENKPWELAKKSEAAALDNVLRVLLEVLRFASVLCVPFMPAKSAEMRKLLMLESDISKLELGEAERPGDPGWKEAGTPASLFPKIEREAE
jgi:methionyl-tRNA synthetase